jgi:hypothetical protein
MRHTPGPWKVKLYAWQRGNVGVFAPKFGRSPYGACVAYTPCSDGVGGSEGALANARLIAASPEMYAALKNLENDDGSIPAHAWALVQSAIAKAEGEKT